MTETSETVSRYQALALQVRCDAVNFLPDRSTAREQMRRAIGRLAEQVRASKAFIGPDTQLVVLPEYFLTGFPMGDAVDAWSDKAALASDGEEYELLGEIAGDNQLYLAGNAYEQDEHFPGLYFQTSFVIDPSGKVVLRYRRLISLFAPTPHDVWDRYLDLYGLEGVFPVARTEIGNLAAVASEEILYPEIARGLALRGAEVFLHSSSEAASPRRTMKDVAKRARALENLAYVVSANSAGIGGIPIPEASTDGGSQVVDFTGAVLVEAGAGESMVAHASIDLEALRAWRRRPGMGNLLSRQCPELFAASYAGRIFRPPSTLLDADGEVIVPDRGHFRRLQEETIERLARDGVI